MISGLAASRASAARWRCTYRGPHRTEWQGVWVELILPASLAGQNVTLQPAMVDSGWFRDDILRQMEERFYQQWLDGH
ncbi:TPA: hypothetical protein ACRNR3_006057 [Pseudomonas aeruginosa]